VVCEVPKEILGFDPAIGLRLGEAADFHRKVLPEP